MKHFLPLWLGLVALAATACNKSTPDAASTAAPTTAGEKAEAFGQLTVLFEGGLAFEGILVAIVARNRPLAVPVVAMFYAYLRQGAQLMNIRTDVPAEVISVVAAIIILLVASQFGLPRWLKRNVLGTRAGATR